MEQRQAHDEGQEVMERQQVTLNLNQHHCIIRPEIQK